MSDLLALRNKDYKKWFDSLTTEEQEEFIAALREFSNSIIEFFHIMQQTWLSLQPVLAEAHKKMKPFLKEADEK